MTDVHIEDRLADRIDALAHDLRDLARLIDAKSRDIALMALLRAVDLEHLAHRLRQRGSTDA